MKNSGNAHRVKASPCPYCDKILDGASASDGSNIPPKSGDVSVCLCCANVVVYGDDLKLRRPTPDESVVLSDDADLQKVQQLVREYHDFKARKLIPDSFVDLSLICCPNCQHELNAGAKFGDKDGAGPSAGSVAICGYCGFPSVFCADGTLRILTSDEREKFEANLLAREVQKKIVTSNKPHDVN